MACPVLVLWATRDDMECLYGDPLAIWRDWADASGAGPSTVDTTWPRRCPRSWRPSYGPSSPGARGEGTASRATRFSASRARSARTSVVGVGHGFAALPHQRQRL